MVKSGFRCFSDADFFLQSEVFTVNQSSLKIYYEHCSEYRAAGECAD